MRQSSLDCSRAEMTARLVHDMNGALSAMSLNVSFVLADLPQDESLQCIREALADANVAGARLARMIRDLHDMACTETAQSGPSPHHEFSAAGPLDSTRK